LAGAPIEKFWKIKFFISKFFYFFKNFFVNFF